MKCMLLLLATTSQVSQAAYPLRSPLVSANTWMVACPHGGHAVSGWSTPGFTAEQHSRRQSVERSEVPPE